MDKKELLIEMFSFGFKFSGIPENTRGNGGGFVFDCRFLPNPYSVESIRHFTGKDIEIKKYFKQYDIVQEFINQIEEMVERAALSYLDRGYSDMQVSFGCTGGRHRSVYCSETVKSVLENKGYNVVLTHKEIG